MGKLKVMGGKIGGYAVGVKIGEFGGVEVLVTGSSHYNHDRVIIQMTPDEAETLAADLIEHARMEREVAKSRRRTELVDGEVEL